MISYKDLRRPMIDGLLPFLTATWIVFAAPADTPELAWHPIAADPAAAPADNPLKGFMPYIGEYDLPHSLEYSYVGLAEAMIAPGNYAFETAIDPLLEDAASRGHQMVLRVFIDYPDETLSLPQFFIDEGITLTPYSDHGGGMSPDYDFPALVEALEDFIAALGARYDGDPRLGYFQVGLLGHWGEWHTYPNYSLFPSLATQNRILAAFDAAFDETHILVSQDSMGQDPVANLAATAVGFHDDAFTEGTLGPDDWMFVPRLNAFGFDERWKTIPMGGEVLPDLQDDILADPPTAPQDYLACVGATHATWLLNQYPFDLSPGDAARRERAIALSRALGYELTVTEAAAQLTTGALTIGVRIENTGVAPFPYDWTVTVRLLDSGGEVLETIETPWRLTEVIPGEPPREWIVEAPIEPQLAACLTEARLWIENPLSGGLPVRFANEGQNGFGLSIAQFPHSCPAR
ncbi:MAG: DUF4832 domain-containing protein [Sumerlaeia bacterium]